MRLSLPGRPRDQASRPHRPPGTTTSAKEAPPGARLRGRGPKGQGNPGAGAGCQAALSFVPLAKVGSHGPASLRGLLGNVVSTTAVTSFRKHRHRETLAESDSRALPASARHPVLFLTGPGNAAPLHLRACPLPEGFPKAPKCNEAHVVSQRGSPANGAISLHYLPKGDPPSATRPTFSPGGAASQNALGTPVAACPPRHVHERENQKGGCCAWSPPRVCFRRFRGAKNLHPKVWPPSGGFRWLLCAGEWVAVKSTEMGLWAGLQLKETEVRTTHPTSTDSTPSHVATTESLKSLSSLGLPLTSPHPISGGNSVYRHAANPSSKPPNSLGVLHPHGHRRGLRTTPPGPGQPCLSSPGLGLHSHSLGARPFSKPLMSTSWMLPQPHPAIPSCSSSSPCCISFGNSHCFTV